MIVIPRNICRDISSALAHEWFVTNGNGSYAAAAVTGTLTRSAHGLLVAALDTPAPRTVMLAKVDEELEVEGQMYKLGTNEYLTNVISPDGFLYLQQVSCDGVCAEFVYESGRFRLTKTIWMEARQATTFIRYTLAEHSPNARLTLLPLCDYRSIEKITQGSEASHFQFQALANGLKITANADARPYFLLLEPAASFTPLDLWYWRFQLRAENNAGLDLFLPGLLRINLAAGRTCTLVATCEADGKVELDSAASFARACARKTSQPLLSSTEFTRDLFAALT